MTFSSVPRAPRHTRAPLRPRLRAWAHMGQSAVFSRIVPGRIGPPRVGYLLVTFRCNLRCRTCSAWKITGHDDLTTDQWIRVFRQARSLDIVKILGGEPFARPDIITLLEAARDIIDPYILQVTTNGSNTEAVVDAVRTMGWPGLQLRISVDGTEKTHDAMRGLPGAWAAADRTLRALAELRPRHGFRVGINFALKDESIQETDRMMAYAEAVGADLIPGVNVEPFLDGSVPPEERPSRFVGLQNPERALPILEHRRSGTRRQLPGVDHLASRLVTGDVFRKEIVQGRLDFPCRSLREVLYVLPDGRVVPCGIDHRHVGNLRDHSLEAIWSSPEAEAGRARVARCPGCLQASIHILSRLYGGRLLDR